MFFQKLLIDGMLMISTESSNVVEFFLKTKKLTLSYTIYFYYYYYTKKIEKKNEKKKDLKRY